jgi:hypothetical protein
MVIQNSEPQLVDTKTGQNKKQPDNKLGKIENQVELNPAGLSRV